MLHAEGYDPLELAADACLLGNGGCDAELRHTAASVTADESGGGGALGLWTLLGVLGLCRLPRRRGAGGYMRLTWWVV